MALVYDTLRTNLLALFAWLGAMVLGVLLWNLADAVRDHVRLGMEADRGAETDALVTLSYDLRREDMAVLHTLTGESPIFPLDAAIAATDRSLATTAALLADHHEGGHDVAVTILETLGSGLADRRMAVRDALNGTAQDRSATLRRWRSFLDASYPDLEAISHDLIRETGTADAEFAPVMMVRFYALFAFRGLIANRFAIDRAMEAGVPVTDRLILLSEASAQLRGAANLAEDQFSIDRSPAFDRIETVTRFLLDDYLATETQLLREMVAGVPSAETLYAWRTASRTAIGQLSEAEAALAAEARFRLTTARAQDRAAISLWLTALILAVTLIASAIRFTLRRIVLPLERIHAKMLRLAHDDLTVEITTRPRLAEIQAMYDALSVFKENGLRRERMQAELARLNDRVVAANQAMTAELEAAARVQAAQLPAPCDLPGARFHTFYRPSRMIAGDTYDFVTLPDGRTRLFQIDVSGHGAAAALVSVMSHIAVKSALQQAPSGAPLTDIVARINTEWNGDLPYFTLLLVEIDPTAGLARIVQAGHPPLLRLPRRGPVETVGNGGMPVGALPWAEYEECTCAFHPGDRLILTTDGVTEAADADGQLFGDDRYLDLLTRVGRSDVKTLFAALDAALWDWCGTEAFDDDVTILILEAKEPAYAH